MAGFHGVADPQQIPSKRQAPGTSGVVWPRPHTPVRCRSLHHLALPGPLWLPSQGMRNDSPAVGKWGGEVSVWRHVACKEREWDSTAILKVNLRLLFRNSSYGEGVASLSSPWHSLLAPVLRPQVLLALIFPAVRLFALGSWSCVVGPHQLLMCSATVKTRRLGPVVPSFSDLFYLHSCPVEYEPWKD